MNVKEFVKTSIGKMILFVGVLLIVLLVVFIWHNQAKNQLEKHSSEWVAEYSELDSIKSRIVDSGDHPKGKVSYADVDQLVNAFESKTNHLGDIQQKIASGEGMNFWLPSRREQAAKLMKDKLDTMDAFIGECRNAIQATSNVNSSTTERINAASAANTNAIALFREDTDINDFQGSVVALQKPLKEVTISIAAVTKEHASSKLKGEAEELRLGIINKMETDLQEQQNLLIGRIAAAKEAQKILFEKMTQLNGMITDSTGFFSQVGWIAEQLQPMSEKAYELTRPLKNLIDEADRPIFGEAGNMLGNLFNRGGGEKLSALSLACQIDPSIKYTVDAFVGVCSAIETTQSEVSGILSATRPLDEAVNTYRSLRSRKAMISLVGATKNAYSYFIGKTRIFDPVISKIEEGRRQIDNVYQVAQRIRLPGAQNLISRLAGSANDVISFAESPFEQGHQAIANLVGGLNNIPVLEKEYVNTLNLLAQDPPPIKISKEISNNIEILKQTIPELQVDQIKANENNIQNINDKIVERNQKRLDEEAQVEEGSPKKGSKLIVEQSKELENKENITIKEELSFSANDLQGIWFTNNNDEISITTTGDKYFTGIFTNKNKGTRLEGKIDGSIIKVTESYLRVSSAQMFQRGGLFRGKYTLEYISPKLLKGSFVEEKTGITYNDIVWEKR